MNLWDQADIITLLKKHNLWTVKSFGQNFLIDKDILQKIINSAKISKQDLVIEIGPGLGVLTNELAKIAKKVTSIELDKKLIPILQETLQGHNNIEIINQDALKTPPPKTKYKVVANIPYNITSPLLNQFLQTKNKPTSLTLLVQKEVAEKLCQKEPKMSILSLQVALFGKAEIISKVPSSCFHPAPKVESAIIHIETYKKTDKNYLPDEKAKKILSLAKIAFSQKRKKLKNTLKNFIKETDLDLTRRPQTLSIKEWLSLI